MLLGTLDLLVQAISVALHYVPIIAILAGSALLLWLTARELRHAGAATQVSAGSRLEEGYRSRFRHSTPADLLVDR